MVHIPGEESLHTLTVSSGDVPEVELLDWRGEWIFLRLPLATFLSGNAISVYTPTTSIWDVCSPITEQRESPTAFSPEMCSPLWIRALRRLCSDGLTFYCGHLDSLLLCASTPKKEEIQSCLSGLLRKDGLHPYHMRGRRGRDTRGLTLTAASVNHCFPPLVSMLDNIAFADNPGFLAVLKCNIIVCGPSSSVCLFAFLLTLFSSFLTLTVVALDEMPQQSRTLVLQFPVPTVCGSQLSVTLVPFSWSLGAPGKRVAHIHNIQVFTHKIKTKID